MIWLKAVAVLAVEIVTSNEMRTIPHIVQTSDNQIRIDTTTIQTLQGLNVGAHIQMFNNEFFVDTTSGGAN